jgi:hypothetical protein
LGNQLDQVFVLNAAVKNAILSSNYDRKFTDHKAIKVELDVGLRHSGSLVEDITDASSIPAETLVANLK